VSAVTPVVTAAMPVPTTVSPARPREQRTCACGGTPGASGECADCRARRLARAAPTVHRLADIMIGNAGPRPSQVCDGVATARPAQPPRTSKRRHDDQLDGGPQDAGPADAAPIAGVATPCTQPINWTHSGGTDVGECSIEIPISWESSTGNLADLTDCTVREVVRYDPIPNPPFIWNPPNPTILEVPGVDGAAQDTHSYPPGLRNGISNPRVAGTATAHQVYQFRCTGPGCSGNWEDFPNQRYTITREVFAQYVRLNPWRYRITKTGVGNTFSYSRECEIPEPAAPPAGGAGPAAPGGASAAPGQGQPAPRPEGPTAPGQERVAPPSTPGGSPVTVCARNLSFTSRANHAYIDAPPYRYAIIGPLCPAHWYDNPATGTSAQKWDDSRDPCGKTPTCLPCDPKPGVTDVARCMRDAFIAYNNPSLYKLLGPNSNTFAGTLARTCCAGMVPKPAALGTCPGWDDPPAPFRAGASPCPPGPPKC
jgi:hypothetical protein